MEIVNTDTQLLTAVIFLSGLMALYGWTRGVLTSFRAAGSWAAGISAGIWAFGNGNDALAKYAGLEFGIGWSAFTSILLAAVTFVAVRWFIKVALDSLFGEGAPLEGLFRGPSGALLSFIPTFAIILMFSFLIRWMGSSVELLRIDQAIASGKNYNTKTFPKDPVTLKWRDSIEKVPFSKEVLDSFDPLSRVAQRHLAALLISSYQPSLRQKISQRHSMIAIVNHPAVIELVHHDAEMEAFVKGNKSLKYFKLLRHDKVRKVIRDEPQLSAELRKVDVPAEIEDVLTAGPVLTPSL